MSTSPFSSQLKALTQLVNSEAVSGNQQMGNWKFHAPRVAVIFVISENVDSVKRLSVGVFEGLAMVGRRRCIR